MTCVREIGSLVCMDIARRWRAETTPQEDHDPHMAYDGDEMVIARTRELSVESNLQLYSFCTLILRIEPIRC